MFNAKRNDRKLKVWVAGFAVATYITLSLASALTKRPWSDEGWFANAPYNLVTKGWMGTTAIEQAGHPFLTGIDQYTYWVMPLHLVLQAGWYKVFGFSLLSLRSISLVWGLVALVSWFIIMRSLSGSDEVALLTVVLLAWDYNFIMSSSFGRMDLMCEALGTAGLASYLAMRDRNLWAAVLVSNCFVVASGMTHHLGILSLFGLAFLILFFDRKRTRWKYIPIALTPYLLGLIAWSFYILKSPHLFAAQFKGNATTDNRLALLTHPLSGLRLEITERYLTGFGLGPHSIGSSSAVRLKALILLAYVLAILGVILVRNIRNNKGYQALLILGAIYFAILTVWDGQKLTWYLIHVVPIYTAILATLIVWCWKKRAVPRGLLISGVFIFIGLQIGGVLQRIRLDTYHRSFAPAVNFLKQRANDGQLIMGSAELGFGLGSFDHLVDDSKLGFYSGKKPDFIVVEEVYGEGFDLLESRHPEIYQFINSRLNNEFTKVYDYESYQIYARR